MIDRGANGSLAGSDVRVISQVNDGKINVEGIDNHQLTDIPLVTAAGVITTQKGPVIVIMNQYAHINQGNTIHSSGQLEAFGTIVHDKAKPNGEHQCIIAQGGYVIPLNVRHELVYMDMRPPTDAELDGPHQLPQMILTSDLEWNPSSIDFEYDPNSWFSQIDDLPNVERPSHFDDYGEYVSDNSIATLCADIEKKYDLENYVLTNCCELINNYTVEERDVTSTPTDYTKYQAQFG